MAQSLHPINTDTQTISPIPQSFSLKASPGTDIYAAPGHGYVWTAPILYTKIQCSSFKKASVTVTFEWTTVFDQGGLVLAFPAPGYPVPDRTNASKEARHPKWVKAGIEINEGRPWASAVARENLADWSCSIPPDGVSSSAEEGDEVVKGKVTAVLEFERHNDALVIWIAAPGGRGRHMIREAQWVFLDGRGDSEALIGVYCCAPDPNEERQGKALEVTFDGFEVESR